MLARFLCLLMCFLSISCQAVAELNPYQLVETVARKTLHRIETNTVQLKADPQYLNVIVKEELMPYVNYRLASKIVLDKVQPEAEEREQFYQAFERHLITTYAAIFSKYDGQKLSLKEPKEFKDKKVVTVNGLLTGKDGKEIDIDFKLRFNKQQQQWAVFDIVVEGISMLNSKKAELMPMLRQPDGVKMAINMLNKKAGSTF